MAPMEATKEVVNVVANNLPVGVEGMDDRDLQIGNLVLVQGKSRAFKGVPEGTFVNSKTGTVIETVEFVPVHMSKFYDLYDAEQTIPKWLGRYFKETAPELEGKRWQYEGKLKPEVIPVISVVAMVNGGKPYFIRFKKTSGFPAGQNLYTMVRDSQQPIFHAKYALKAVERTSKDNVDFFALEVTRLSDTDEQEREAAHSLYRTVSQNYQKVHGNQQDEEQLPF